MQKPFKNITREKLYNCIQINALRLGKTALLSSNNYIYIITLYINIFLVHVYI